MHVQIFFCIKALNQSPISNVFIVYVNSKSTSNRSFFAFLNSMGVTCESFGGISDQQANNDSESSEEENESESDNEEESDDDISE